MTTRRKAILQFSAAAVSFLGLTGFGLKVPGLSGGGGGGNWTAIVKDWRGGPGPRRGVPCGD